MSHSKPLQNNSATPPARIRSLESLGRLFRAERKRQGLTLEGLYAATGLSTRFLSQFERGQANVSLDSVLRALEALGLDMMIFSRRDAERILSRDATLHREESE